MAKQMVCPKCFDDKPDEVCRNCGYRGESVESGYQDDC